MGSAVPGAATPVDTSDEAVERLARFAETRATLAEAAAGTNSEPDDAERRQKLQLLAQDHRDTAATLRALLAERDRLRTERDAYGRESEIHAATVRQAGADGHRWWHANGARWYGEAAGRLSVKQINAEGCAAVCAILGMNGIPAWLGDGTGMVLNIIRDLAMARDAAAKAAADALPHLIETVESIVRCHSTAYHWTIAETVPEDCKPEAEEEARAMLRSIAAIQALTGAATDDADG